MSHSKVKVVGYAKRTFFDNGIEYRNFSPDLVGVQLASDGGTPLFTMGNFSITTNIEPKSSKIFTTNKFSNFISLVDLDLTLEKTEILLNDNANVNLNLDKSNLKYYALFGSLTEFVRISLEDIIIKWPASLYMTPISQTSAGIVVSGYTVEDYFYNSLTEISTFKVDTNFINNKFGINFLKNGSIVDTFNETNDLRNLTVNYISYSILHNNREYPIIDFSGSTVLKNDYIFFTVRGNPFSDILSNSFDNYHVKPNNSQVEQFFNSLPDFEAYLLNRQILPIYTANFKFPTKSDEGVIIYVTETITWPVSDGYNIDFDTTAYVDYATQLLNISTNSDLFSSDLLNRFLVTESISDFDTSPVHLSDLDKDTSGQKMNKTLHIYGRNFDEINNLISGIAFAHTVTYNKQDNTPDAYLKTLASVLGWELISSVLENNLLANYVTTKASTYSGQSVGLTPVDSDIELWRRLILNSPWLWKSKGARKSIEFLLKFIGAPQGLVSFNEYIYKAEAPIDVDLFRQALSLNNLDPDISLYPIDSNGYPNPLPNTPKSYFQGNGLWYRETGGSGSTIDISTGNNPHLGPYDGGGKFINNFKTLIPNFSAVTISSETTTTSSTNLFTNYNLGTITNYTGDVFVDATNEDGSSLDGCVVVTSTIIEDPKPVDTITDCGCISASDDDSLSICVKLDSSINVNTNNIPCKNSLTTLPTEDNELGVYSFSFYQYNPDGSIYMDNLNNPIPNTTFFATKECCSYAGGTPTLFNQIIAGSLINSGYICCTNNGKCGCSIACGWLSSTSTIALPVLSPTYSGPQSEYLIFINNLGQSNVVTPDGCNCIDEYTIPIPNITDPFTGQVGYGCQLTKIGLGDIILGVNGVIYKKYNDRKNGLISCYE
jgi:hypothetical protein